MELKQQRMSRCVLESVLHSEPLQTRSDVLNTGSDGVCPGMMASSHSERRADPEGSAGRHGGGDRWTKWLLHSSILRRIIQENKQLLFSQFSETRSGGKVLPPTCGWNESMATSRRLNAQHGPSEKLVSMTMSVQEGMRSARKALKGPLTDPAPDCSPAGRSCLRSSVRQTPA